MCILIGYRLYIFQIILYVFIYRMQYMMYLALSSSIVGWFHPGRFGVIFCCPPPALPVWFAPAAHWAAPQPGCVSAACPAPGPHGGAPPPPWPSSAWPPPAPASPCDRTRIQTLSVLDYMCLFIYGYTVYLCREGLEYSDPQGQDEGWGCNNDLYMSKCDMCRIKSSIKSSCFDLQYVL